MYSGQIFKTTQASYRLKAKIAEGGYSEVWLATTRNWSKVIIKMPSLKALQRVARSEWHYYREHLWTEIEFLQRAQHDARESIIELLDVGSYDLEGEAFPFLVLESMETNLCHCSPPDNLATILSWFQQITQALGTVHRLGYQYRDLKRSNILLDANGEILKLIDFGALQPDDPNRLYAMAGTSAYMAPEQFTPASSAVSQTNSQYRYATDRRTDWYSLGLILFWLVTGEDYHPESPQQDRQRFMDRLVHLQNSDNTRPLVNSDQTWFAGPMLNPLSTHLTALLEQLLAKDRETRPESAEDILKQIQPWITPTLPKPTKPSIVRPWHIGLAMLFLLTLLINQVWSTTPEHNAIELPLDASLLAQPIPD